MSGQEFELNQNSGRQSHIRFAPKVTQVKPVYYSTPKYKCFGLYFMDIRTAVLIIGTLEAMASVAGICKCCKPLSV